MFTEAQQKILKIVVVVSIVSAFVGVFFAYQIGNFGMMLKILTMAMPQRQFTTNTNVLIIGVDNSVDGGARRSDTIMVANINPYTKYVGILSIPRDTRMLVEGHGFTKVNHAYAYGGVKLLRQTVSNFLNIPIPYYVVVDLQGVGAIVNDLGGIPITIDKRMHYIDRAGDLYIDLYPGQQVLDGNHAMQYIRYRSDGTDLNRIVRQQKFMTALGGKLMQLSNVFRAPTIIFRFSKYIRTNIPASYLVDFSMKLKDAYQLGHLDIKTVPTSPLDIDGIAYLQPDWQATQDMVQRVIKGYEFIKSPLPDPRQPPELAVQLLNGNGVNRIGKNAERKLRTLGYPVTDIRDAGRTDYQETLLINWHGEALEDEAFYLARKLYINPTNIITYNYPKKPISFSIVLGHDWPIER